MILQHMQLKHGLIIILAIMFCFYYIFPFNFNIFHQSEHQPVFQLHKLYKSRHADDFVPLSQSVINNVKYFIFFLGLPHSGHSIVGSILDGHPHMVVAHEAKIFHKLKDYPARYTNKAAVINELWANSYNVCHHGWRTNHSDSKGYSLEIEGVYQGTFVSHIDVIGDKNAGKTTALLVNNSSEWTKVFDKLKSLVNIPIKVIHVIRNPYDNIATSRLYNFIGDKPMHFKDIRAANKTFELNYNHISKQIDKQFKFYQVICDVEKEYNLDLLEIHGKDLVENPKATILKMCDFLGVSCSDQYIDVCSNKLFKTESKTRYKIQWTPTLISKVQKYISKYDSLLRYHSFDS